MAYRRTLSERAGLFYRQRFSPSFSYINRDDDRKHQCYHNDRSFHSFLQQNQPSLTNLNNSLGVGSLYQAKLCSQLFAPSMAASMGFGRHMSTAIGEETNKIEYMTDMAEVLVDKTTDAVAAVSAATPIANEVAIAAADSALPVAALQHLIDAVHTYTGLNWWASIALTTFLIRGATIPLLINQLKSTTQLSLLRPKLEEIKQEVSARGMDPQAVSEGQQRMQALFKEYGVTPFTPLKGMLFQGPVFISFFFAITNMVEKVPSLKTGGLSWFTDLTTPDSMYILPCCAALTFWITVECNMQDGMEGNPAVKTIKNVSRGFAALTVPFTMSFPKAIFFYWVTSNIFSLLYGLVLKAPGVKKMLGIPVITIAPSTVVDAKPPLPFFEALKKYAAAQKYAAEKKKQEGGGLMESTSTDESKPVDRRIPPSAILSQRIRSLEKQVKARKKTAKK
ncbi:mitochondrial inner membrane protein OXA1-like [Impatiens glandulifera]|uniref:mitochondrial inner membrane protein OXA1-like n=1 Tax=Impatiens glandulifera TaxID=253017 RepID=UPI001FB0D222|nr:mitochondrial inner membrane protein OXA1-like [Impatiens glandulifera]